MPVADDVVLAQCFSNPASLSYFRDAFSRKAMATLVHRAVSKQARPTGIPNPEDMKMYTQLCYFVAKLTRTQREVFADTLALCTSATKEQLGYAAQRLPNNLPNQAATLPNLVRFPVPDSRQSIRSIFCEGKFAVLQNLPMPTVHVFGDHAYCLPSKCVADAMAHGLMDNRNSRHTIQSVPESDFARST